MARVMTYVIDLFDLFQVRLARHLRDHFLQDHEELHSRGGQGQAGGRVRALALNVDTLPLRSTPSPRHPHAGRCARLGDSLYPVLTQPDALCCP